MHINMMVKIVPNSEMLVVIALTALLGTPVFSAEKISDRAKTAAPVKAVTRVNAASPSKATAPSASASGWMLDQRSRVVGDQTMYVSAIGVKVVNRKDGLTITTAAPFSEVFTYSLKTRKFCRQTSDKSENPYARAVAMFSGIAHGDVPMKKQSEYKKGGLLWSHFSIPEEYKKARIALFQKHEVTGSEPASGRMVGFHMAMEKRAVDWIARLLCVPKTGTVPFDVTFVDVDNESHSLVKTFRMLPKKFTATDFKCPPGLHSVKDPRAVTQDETANDAIEMMMSGSDRDGKPRGQR